MYNEVGETLSFITLPQSNADKKLNFFQIFKLHCKSESSGEFLIQQIRGGARRFAFPTSSRVMLVLLILGSHFENHWSRFLETGTYTQAADSTVGCVRFV